MPNPYFTQPEPIFWRFIDRLIPIDILSDYSDRFRARSLVLFILILVSLSVLSLMSLSVMENALPERRLVSLVLVLSQLTAIVVMNLTRRFKVAAWLSIGLMCAFVEYVDYNNLSVQGPVTFAWIVPPTLAAMLLGKRASLLIGIIIVAAVSYNVWALKHGLLPTPITDPATWESARFIIILSVLVVVVFCVAGLDLLAERRSKKLSQEIDYRVTVMYELEQARDLAESSAKSKAMFLATMSHELRTPLNGVLGNASLLEREPLSDKARLRVKDIVSSGQLLLSTINDVLDLSKLESEGLQLNHEVYDVAAQLQTLHRMLAVCVSSNVAFHLRGCDAPIAIRADQHRIAQIITNLVSNAAKFTHEGEVSVALAFNASNQLCLSVKDTGIGISEEDQKGLFEEFVQVNTPYGLQQGSGLGLAIVQRIVVAMNGKVELNSELGEGAEFTVTLPIEAQSLEALAEEQNQQTQSEPQSLAGLRQVNELKVLIADDVVMNCVILEALLAELGIVNTTLVYDGLEAVEALEKNADFDLIFMDVRMPKIDGHEACRQIRAMGFNGPIIAVSANAYEEDRQACLAAGMDELISKPLVLEALETSLVTVMQAQD